MKAENPDRIHYFDSAKRDGLCDQGVAVLSGERSTPDENKVTCEECLEILTRPESQTAQRP